jgi:transaldolase
LASAFKELGSILPADGGDCEDLLSRFADAGVDIDSLATQLQEEGAKAFFKSWGELMSVIEGTGVKLNQPDWSDHSHSVAPKCRAAK